MTNSLQPHHRTEGFPTSSQRTYWPNSPQPHYRTEGLPRSSQRTDWPVPLSLTVELKDFVLTQDWLTSSHGSHQRTKGFPTSQNDSPLSLHRLAKKTHEEIPRCLNTHMTDALHPFNLRAPQTSRSYSVSTRTYWTLAILMRTGFTSISDRRILVEKCQEPQADL
jgi:hypothetical protein